MTNSGYLNFASRVPSREDGVLFAALKRTNFGGLYYNEDRPAYYSALANADSKGGDLTEWLEYFLFGIAVEISRVENTIKKLSSECSMKEKYGQIGLSSRQIKAVGYLKENGQITNKEYQKICDVSQPTANRDLQDMVDKNVLKQKGKKGQQITYVLNF